MPLRARVLLCTAVVAAFASSLSWWPLDSGVAAQQPANKYRAQRDRRIRDQYIVVLRDQADAARLSPEARENIIASAASELSARHGGVRRHLYSTLLNGFSVRISEAAARRLSEDPRVALVAEDGVVSAGGTQTSPVNWGLDRIDQRQLPLDASFEYFAEGSGVNVYVMDSGINAAHAAFEGRAQGVYDAIGDGYPVDQDCNGHGTNVAGIVGSSLYGVAKKASLFSVRVLGCDNTGSWAGVIAGLDWVAANHATPAVVNFSLGGGSNSVVDAAIGRLEAAGVLLVGAAMNASQDACLWSPASSAAGLIVGSIMMDNARSSFSNYGTCVDIYAPGHGITSASARSTTGTSTYYGTSQATPHVTGAAALYLQRHPSATPAALRNQILRVATAGIVTDHIAGPNFALFSLPLGDVELPTVRVNTPANGATVAGPVSITVSGSDNAEMSSVTFFVDTTRLALDTTEPYSTVWDSRSVSNGSHTLRAVALDLAGNSREATVTVKVSNGADSSSPAVALTFPSPGSTVGGTVTLTATATDNVAVDRVEFLGDGAVLGTDTSAPYSFVWNTAGVANGDHTLTARAVDTSSNASVSAPVVVHVDNTPVGLLPSGWTASDVGAVGTAGASSYGTGVFTLRGAGQDLWAASDAFHFAHRSWTGDGEIVARLTELPRPSGASFALAGIMFRESLAANSPHAALLVGTDGKLKFRRRMTTGATTQSEGPSAGSITVPRWLKLTRTGGVFSAFSSSDGSTWTPVATPAAMTLPATVRVGVWALRNGGSALVQAKFSDVSATIPGGWSADDVGAVGVAGKTVESGGKYTLQGAGTDLWEAADGFHFVHRSWTGDGDLVTALATLSKPAGASWAMGGVMIRESLAAGSRHAALLVSTDGKLKFRRRLSTGATTLSNGPSVGSTHVPRWLKLSRRGAVVSAYVSTDGLAWTAVHVPQPIALPQTVEVGVWVLRSGGVDLGQATFEQLRVIAPGGASASDDLGVAAAASR